MPESLLRVGDAHALKSEVVHLAEHLWRVDLRVGHHEAAGVPQRGACARGEFATVDAEAVDVPEGIFALEAAVYGLDVTAILESRLAGMNSDIFQAQAGAAEQRTLAAEFFIFYQLHDESFW